MWVTMMSGYRMEQEAIRYADVRLPKSDYFRLSETQQLECANYLLASGGKNDFKPFFTGPKLFITFMSAWLILSLVIIKFGIQPIFEKFS